MISFNDDLVMIDFGYAAKFDANGFVHYESGGNLLHLSPEVLQVKKSKKIYLVNCNIIGNLE